MKWYLFLLLGLFSLNLRAQEIPCPTPSDILDSSLALEDFRDLCNAVVATNPNCQSVKPELLMNCESPQDNKLLSDDLILEKIGGCLKGLFLDSITEIGELIVEMISTLVDVNIKTAKGMYEFFSDEKYRSNLINKFQNSSSETGKLISSFFRMSAAYFSQNFARNLKESYYSPMVAIPKTFFQPFVRFLADTVKGIAEQYVGEFQCMNGPAKANSICKMIGTLLVPPTGFFAYLKGSKTAILMMKNLKKGRGVIGSIRETHNALNILKVSSKLKDPERIAEAARVLGKEFDMTEAKAKALIKAHNVGLNRGYFKYTPEDIDEKARILKEAGFGKAERRILMDRGLVGGFSKAELVAKATEASTRASALALEMAKTAGAFATHLAGYKQELKQAADYSVEAGKHSGDLATYAKSWQFLLRAGDATEAMNFVRKGVTEMGISPSAILRNLGEKYELRLAKAKAHPNDPVVQLELKAMRELDASIRKEFASAEFVAGMKPLTVESASQVAANVPIPPKPVAAPVSPPKPVAPPKPAQKPAPAVAKPTTSTTPEPVVSVRPTPESMTPREASDMANKLRLERQPEEASKYYLRAAQKRTLEDRNFNIAIEESMKGDGSVVIDIIKNGRKEQKLMNAIINDFYEQQFQYEGSMAVKMNLKKIVEALDSDPELRSLLYGPQHSNLDSFRRHTHNLGQ